MVMLVLPLRTKKVPQHDCPDVEPQLTINGGELEEVMCPICYKWFYTEDADELEQKLISNGSL